MTDRDLNLNVRVNNADAAKLDSLAGKVDDVGAKFEEAGGKVDDLGSSVEGLSGATPSIDDLSTSADGVSSSADGATTSVDGLDMSVSGLSGGASAFDDLSAAADGVTSSADGATQAVEGVDNVDLSGVQGQLDSVGGAADNVASGSVPGMGRSISRMATQALKDIPGVGSAFGNLTPVVGRMVGAMAMAPEAIGAMLPPMLALTAGVLVITTITKALKEIDPLTKLNAEQFKNWTDVLVSGKSAADDFITGIIKNEGKLDFINEFGKKDNLTPFLEAAGVSFGQFFQAIEGGPEALGKLSAAMEKTNVDGYVQGEVMKGAEDAATNYAKAQGIAAQFNEVLTGNADKLAASLLDTRDTSIAAATATAKNTQATKDAAQAAKDVTAAEDAQELAFKNVTQAIKDQRQSELDAIDTNAAFNEQVLQTNIDLEAYEDTLKHHKGTVEETMLATAKMGDEVYATAQKFAEQQGAVKGSQQAIDLEVESLTQTRNTLDPSSALYQYLDGYIKKLQSIPTSVSTSISAQGKIGGHAYASGTRSAASGLALVGEDGPEIVNFGGGEGVTPAGPTAALLNGGGGHTFIINTGADPRQVITIIKQYLKNGGQL